MSEISAIKATRFRVYSKLYPGVGSVCSAWFRAWLRGSELKHGTMHIRLFTRHHRHYEHRDDGLALCLLKRRVCVCEHDRVNMCANLKQERRKIGRKILFLRRCVCYPPSTAYQSTSRAESTAERRRAYVGENAFGIFFRPCVFSSFNLCVCICHSTLLDA